MALGYSQDIIDNAGEAGSMFGSAIMESMGYENEGKAVDRIIRNADWDTDEGKETALNAVRSISPNGYAELVKQLNETARAEAETANIEMQMQNAELSSIKALKSGTWATDWQLDAGPTGAAVTLQNWLRANGYKSEEIADITTTAQAATFLNEKIDTGASGTIRIMQEYMNNSRNMYIENKMYQTYNERHGIEQPKIDATGLDVTATGNDFDAALTDAGNIDGKTAKTVTGGRQSFAGVFPHDLTLKQKVKKRSDITPTNRFSHLK
jgi:hypothetical protein